MLGAQVARGRPRNPNVRRDRSGKSRGLSAAQIKTAALFYRGRDLELDGIHPRHADDALAGTTLGRLYLRHQSDAQNPGGISREQYNAGNRWCEIVHRHASIMGYSLGSPRSPSDIMVGHGLSCTAEPTDEEISRIRDQYRECHEALSAASVGPPIGHGSLVMLATYGVCVEDRPVSTLTTADYGALRIGLNALARVLR